MSSVVELLCSRRAPQTAVLALLSIGFAGCSADMQTRLSENPFHNSPQSSPQSSRQGQFGWQRGEATGSVRQPQYQQPQYQQPQYQQPQYQRPELPQYQRPQYQPQAQYQSQPLPPPAATPQNYSSYSAPVSGGGRGVGSYTPPAPPVIAAPATTAPRSVAAAGPSSVVPANAMPATVASVPARDGGTKIIVGTSDTLDIIARRYNVSTAAIMKANGYSGARVLSPGQSLIIPRQSVQAAVAPAAVAPVASAGNRTHVVNPGDTLMSISRRNNVSLSELARANNMRTDYKLKLGERVVVPGGGRAPAQVAAAVAPVAAPVVAAPPPVPQRVASAEPAQKARLANASVNAEEVAAPTPAVKAAEATGALPSFRWPVRGRVIASYGSKAGGKANDGINVAVPEGTPVKAAEDGVVAYAGNELKGYGNLVLVRHSNGYVTAYAHASEVMVKRGETIKRGQTIAKSGQSGDAGSPQLHFEIRKGSTPVDPLQFLNGA